MGSGQPIREQEQFCVICLLEEEDLNNEDWDLESHLLEMT